MMPLGQTLPFLFAKKHNLAIHWEESLPVVYMTEGAPFNAVLEVQRLIGKMITPTVVSDDRFAEVLEAVYNQSDANRTQLLSEELSSTQDLLSLASSIPDEDLLDFAEDAPIVKFINAIFSEAIQRNASDIHIESFENRLVVRMRIDGVLKEIVSPDKRLNALLISRIKVLAKLDIAEKRIPQDGRISIKIAGRAVDVRVSILPTGHGERAVLRILDKRASQLSLDHLGMRADIYASYTDLLSLSNGIILVTGPTGAGKTTSLYAGLKQVNNEATNILTIEDPIEYALEGIGQTQVNAKTGMTFDKGLRAILRQDPDVVMVGEIRDIETANIAIQASLTGHLVLSTLHTNSAIATLTRLLDLGVEGFLIASSLKGILAQRLVRCLCEHCKQPVTVNPHDADLLGLPADTTVYQPVGCDECLDTGYRGRRGIYEMLVINHKVQRLLQQDPSEANLTSNLGGDFITLLDDGKRLIEEGETSVSEVLRVVR